LYIIKYRTCTPYRRFSRFFYAYH